MLGHLEQWQISNVSLGSSISSVEMAATTGISYLKKGRIVRTFFEVFSKVVNEHRKTYKVA